MMKLVLLLGMVAAASAACGAGEFNDTAGVCQNCTVLTECGDLGHTACTGTADSTCNTCDDLTGAACNMEPNKWETASCNSTAKTPMVCATCKECGGTEYVSAACQVNDTNHVDTGCTTCTTCGDGNYAKVACTATTALVEGSDTQCVAHTSCPWGVKTVGNATADNSCYTQCSGDKFRKGGICTDHNNCTGNGVAIVGTSMTDNVCGGNGVTCTENLLQTQLEAVYAYTGTVIAGLSGAAEGNATIGWASAEESCTYSSKNLTDGSGIKAEQCTCFSAIYDFYSTHASANVTGAQTAFDSYKCKMGSGVFKGKTAYDVMFGKGGCNVAADNHDDHDHDHDKKEVAAAPAGAAPALAVTLAAAAVALW